jgi:hypothetical protein
LRGRLMVGRLTLDQVVKVRVLAPQPDKAPAQGAFLFLAEPHSVPRGNVGATADFIASVAGVQEDATQRFNRLTTAGHYADAQRVPRPQPEIPPNTLQTGRCGARNKKGDPCAATLWAAGVTEAEERGFQVLSSRPGRRKVGSRTLCSPTSWTAS